VRQRLPQPRQPLALAAAAELVTLIVRFEQRLLHHVGRVELAAQPRVELVTNRRPRSPRSTPGCAAGSLSTACRRKRPP
jgi:hypothetical protein